MIVETVRNANFLLATIVGSRFVKSSLEGTADLKTVAIDEVSLQLWPDLGKPSMWYFFVKIDFTICLISTTLELTFVQIWAWPHT